MRDPVKQHSAKTDRQKGRVDKPTLLLLTETDRKKMIEVQNCVGTGPLERLEFLVSAILAWQALVAVELYT
jgi:hypothetical protein